MSNPAAENGTKWEERLALFRGQPGAAPEDAALEHGLPHQRWGQPLRTALCSGAAQKHPSHDRRSSAPSPSRWGRPRSRSSAPFPSQQAVLLSQLSVVLYQRCSIQLSWQGELDGSATTTSVAVSLSATLVGDASSCQDSGDSCQKSGDSCQDSGEREGQVGGRPSGSQDGQGNPPLTETGTMGALGSTHLICNAHAHKTVHVAHVHTFVRICSTGLLLELH